MRLLVHGGTLHGERQRVGTWPKSILPGTLEDTYGLLSDAYSFGLGLLENQYFLIIRKVHVHLQRPYPVAILLDAGPILGDKFNWNAAHLAHALFGEEDSPGHRLITNPEMYCTEDSLRELLESLDSSRLPALSSEEIKRNRQADFLNFLVGAHSGGLTGRIALPPVSVGLERRPFLREAALLLDRLPTCFRMGAGWLVGGSKKHGEILGAQVILDDRLLPNSPAVDSDAVVVCVKHGTRLMMAWSAFKDARSDLWDETLKGPIEERFVRHSGGVEVSLNDASDPFFDDFIFLGECLSGPVETEGGEAGGIEWRGSVDGIVRKVREKLNGRNTLAEQTLIAGYEQAVSGSGKEMLSGPRTQFALEVWFLQHQYPRLRQIEMKHEALTARLDPQTVVDTLTRKMHAAINSSSSQEKSLAEAIFAAFPATVRKNVWTSLIKAQDKCASIQSLLVKAIQDLRPDGKKEGLTEAEIQFVAVVALKHSVDRGCSPLIWNKFPGHPIAEPYISDLLQKQAREQAMRGAEGWPVLYLVYGKDSGGQQWESLKLGRDRARQLISYLVKEVEEKRDYSREASQWLDDLASSPLRGPAHITEKLNIIRLLNGRWHGLRSLYELYKGEAPSGPNAAIDPEELDRLYGELQDIVKSDCNRTDQTQPIDFIPNLEKIILFFEGRNRPERPGSPNANTGWSFMNCLRPRLSWKRAVGWLKGWQRIDADFYHDELNRLIIDSGEAVPKEFKLELYTDQEKLAELFRTLLYKRGEGFDAGFRKIARELITFGGSDGRLEAAIKKVYEESRQDRSKMDALLRRYFPEPSPLLKLIQNISPQFKDELQALIEERERLNKAEREAREKREVEELLSYGKSDDVQRRARAGNSFINLIPDVWSQADEEKKAALAHGFRDPQTRKDLFAALPKQTKAEIEAFLDRRTREELREKLRKHLYSERTTEDPPYEFIALLENEMENPAFREIVEAELWEHIQTRNNRIWGLYASDTRKNRRVLFRLFKIIKKNLELQDQLTAGFFGYSPDLYGQEAESTFKYSFAKQAEMVLSSPDGKKKIAIEPFEEAVLRFLTTDIPEVKEIKDRIGNHTYGLKSYRINDALGLLSREGGKGQAATRGNVESRDNTESDSDSMSKKKLLTRMGQAVRTFLEKINPRKGAAVNSKKTPE